MLSKAHYGYLRPWMHPIIEHMNGYLLLGRPLALLVESASCHEVLEDFQPAAQQRNLARATWRTCRE